jgi:hypothetical protein
LLRGLGDGAHRLTTAFAFAAVFLAAAGQTGWLLRPYLVRPRTEDVPFVRSREGGVGDALYRTTRSSVGLFDRARAATGSRRGTAPTTVETRVPYTISPDGTMSEPPADPAEVWDPIESDVDLGEGR